MQQNTVAHIGLRFNHQLLMGFFFSLSLLVVLLGTSNAHALTATQLFQMSET